MSGSKRYGGIASSEFDLRAYALRAGNAKALRERLESSLPWYRHFLATDLPASSDARILDLPCGAGNLTYSLRALGFTNVLGVDVDPGQVAFAEGMGLPVRVGDVFGVLEDAVPSSVSRIFTLDFLEHLEPKRASEFVRLARDRLESGGKLLARVPSADGPFGSHDRYNDITHRWALTAESAFSFFALAGFPGASVSLRQEAPVPYKWQNVARLALFRATTASLDLWLNLAGIGAPAIWTRSMWIVARK